MKSDDLRNYSHIVLMLTLAVVSGQVGWKAYRLIVHSDDLVRETRQSVKNTSQNANAVLIQLGLMADQAALASRVTKEAAEEQKKLIAATSDNIRQSAADMDRLILHTDVSLNQDLFPQMSATLAAANLELQRTGDDSHNTFLATQQVLGAANQRLDDPAIAAILKTTSYTSENIAATTKDIRDTVHQAVKPRNKLLTLVQIVFGIGSKAGSMAAGFR